MPSQTLDISITPGWSCAGRCTSHCREALSENLPLIASNISPGVQAVVHQLMCLPDFSESDLSLELQLSETNSINTICLGKYSSRVSGLNLLMNQWSYLENPQWLFVSIGGLLSVSFPNTTHLVIGAQRSPNWLEKQYEIMPDIVRRSIDYLRWNNQLESLQIRCGSNSIPVGDFEEHVGYAHGFHSSLKATHIAVDGSYSTIERVGLEIWRLLQDTWFSGLRQDFSSHEDRLDEIVWTLCSSGGQKLLIDHYLHTQITKQKWLKVSEIIWALQDMSTPYDSLKISWSQVNVYHSTDTTNTDWVWISSLAEYRALLNRAWSIWYNQALIEHFQKFV